jgi:hypothetical protein
MAIPGLVLKFFGLLLGSMLLILGLHLTVLYFQALPLLADLILWSYFLNFAMASSIFMALYLLRIRLKNQIGFLYLGGSMLKFLIFFLIFYPVYKADGEISNLEFASFFIPYLVCLVMETFFTAKMLNTLK